MQSNSSNPSTQNPTQSGARVVTYLRKSTNRQENSIARQRDNVAQVIAREGYHLVEEITDEGERGHSLDRPGLKRIQQMCEQGLIDGVLVDELKRFARLGLLEYAQLLAPIHHAGIWLESYTQGRMDFDSLEGQLMFTVHASGSKEESNELARRNLETMANLAEEGRWFHGKPPYGYQKKYVEKKLNNGQRRLVPETLIPDPETADRLRWIFEKFNAGEYSLESMARELNARGAVAPGKATKRSKDGKSRWTTPGLKVILKNPAYYGCYVWGRRSQGQYKRLQGAQKEIVDNPERNPKKKDRIKHKPESEWIVIPDHFEALVSKELWDSVQERLEKNSNRCVGTARKGFVLTGLIRCGNCGRTLKSNGGRGILRYRCSRLDECGNVVCGSSSIRQNQLLDLIVIKLQDHFLNPDNLAELREELRAQEKAERSDGNLQKLKREVNKLEDQLQRLRRNVGLIDDEETVLEINNDIRNLRKQKQDKQDELDAIGTTDRVADLDRDIKEMESLLWSLREVVAEGEPTLIRELMAQVIDHVTVDFAKRPQSRRSAGQRQQYDVTGGVICVRLPLQQRQKETSDR